jgi:transposase
MILIKKHHFMVLKISVGLDVSSKKVDACLSTIDNNQTVKVKSSLCIDNSKSGFLNLIQWIQKWAKKEDVPMSICLEATGVYHENLAYYLDDAGCQISIVLPNKAKKYLQSLGLKSKNDKIDAKGLARMGAEQNLQKWVRPDTIFVALRALTRQYQSIQESITAEKNKLHAEECSAFKSKEVIKQIKSLIKFLEKQRAEIVKAIEAAVKGDRLFKSKIDRICTVRGLSILSVVTVIAETLGFQEFYNYKQVVSYAGYDVVENQSGSHVGKTRISKKGNSRIRRILHMPSLTAMSSKDTVFENLYTRVYERTGIKMKGIVAVQKKLLLTIYYLWKKNEAFDKNYQNKANVNIQKEEQAPASRYGSKGAKKDSQTKSLATQGKHPVSDYSMPPLGNGKIKRNNPTMDKELT